jgi:hypothetical protein
MLDKLQKRRARQKQYRQRQARGVFRVSIELTAARYEKLLRLNYLRADTTDRAAIARAVEELLDLADWREWP